jgi:carboxypeptidase Taq
MVVGRARTPIGVSEAYGQLRQRFAEISDLGRARALLAWDERTMMPPAGAETRAEQSATLVRVRHERLTSDELGSLLDRLGDWAEQLAYDSDEASLVRAARREWEKARRVPVELRGEIARSASLAETAWEGARRDSDFAAFRPHLERNLELAHRYAECFEGFEDISSAYDALLDDYEPGMRTAELRALLGALRDGLRPLLDTVLAAEQVDDSPLHGPFPLQAQHELMREVASALPLDPNGWRLDESAHPFSTSIGEGDLRITTRYDESYIGTALWSVLHEGGHAIYEAGADPTLRRTPVGHPVSLGFHESQSRLWENWVGRGRPYLDWLHPHLARAFPQALDGASPEELYRAANRVQPSLIRVEADELTYNLHIALRFELELELIEGDLSVGDLPEAWNARTASYLGLEVPDDADGVLQDVHWAGGAFGYFPTYSLGNVIAGQLWELAGAELGDLDDQIRAGEMAPLREWLRQRLHRHGAKFTPRELAERVLGGGFDVGPLVRHLERKLGEVYGAPLPS